MIIHIVCDSCTLHLITLIHLYISSISSISPVKLHDQHKAQEIETRPRRAAAEIHLVAAAYRASGVRECGGCCGSANSAVFCRNNCGAYDVSQRFPYASVHLCNDLFFKNYRYL